jgi:ubiquinone/menaquinone biosynthesis C-methylase UbiE
MLDSAKHVSAPIAIRMLDHVGLNKDTSTPFKLIDCACGAGVVASEVQSMIKPDVLQQSSILACDFSEQMVGITQRRIAREGWVNTEAKQIDAQVYLLLNQIRIWADAVNTTENGPGQQ